MISHTAALAYVEGLDLWVSDNMVTLTDDQRRTVVSAVARIYVLAVSSIHSLTTTVEPSPPVTPKALIAATMIDPAAIISSRRDQFLPSFGEKGIPTVGVEFNELRREYATYRVYRNATLNHYVPYTIP